MSSVIHSRERSWLSSQCTPRKKRVRSTNFHGAMRSDWSKVRSARPPAVVGLPMHDRAELVANAADTGTNIVTADAGKLNTPSHMQRLLPALTLRRWSQCCVRDSWWARASRCSNIGQGSDQRCRGALLREGRPIDRAGATARACSRKRLQSFQICVLAGSVSRPRWQPHAFPPDPAFQFNAGRRGQQEVPPPLPEEGATVLAALPLPLFQIDNLLTQSCDL